MTSSNWKGRTMAKLQSVAAWFRLPSNLVASALVIGGPCLNSLEEAWLRKSFQGWDLSDRPVRRAALVVRGVALLAGRQPSAVETAEAET